MHSPKPPAYTLTALRASDKELVLWSRAGHDTAAPLLEAQFRLLSERVLPLVHAAEEGAR